MATDQTIGVGHCLLKDCHHEESFSCLSARSLRHDHRCRRFAVGERQWLLGQNLLGLGERVRPRLLSCVELHLLNEALGAHAPKAFFYRQAAACVPDQLGHQLRVCM